MTRQEIVEYISDVLFSGDQQRFQQFLDDWKRISERRFQIWERMRTRTNFNPPERWELMQDKRRNTFPLGRNTYLYKARKAKSLARSTHTHSALHKGKENSGAKQCKHTFRITVARCAPCSGYNTECEHYEKNDAADTKHGDSRL